eukprot:s3565_g3.t1
MLPVCGHCSCGFRGPPLDAYAARRRRMWRDPADPELGPKVGPGRDPDPPDGLGPTVLNSKWLVFAICSSLGFQRTEEAPRV